MADGINSAFKELKYNEIVSLGFCRLNLMVTSAFEVEIEMMPLEWQCKPKYQLQHMT
jgi:hypothetical protein